MKKIFVIMVALMSLICFPIFSQAQTASSVSGSGATSTATGGSSSAVGGTSNATGTGGSAVANPTINTGATASPTINFKTVNIQIPGESPVVAPSATSKAIPTPPSTGTPISVAVDSPSASIALSQTTEAPSGGIYRQFMYPVQPLGAPIVPYLGPWKDGVNVLENLDFIPKKITLAEAKNMAVGKVDLQLRIPKKGNVEYDNCQIIDYLPTDYILRGYIFSKATDEANTVDVIMHSYVTAMNNGANALYALKKQSETEASSKGWQVGLGLGGSALTGADKTGALTGSVGFGFGGSKAKPIYKDGIAFMMIEIPTSKSNWVSPGAKAVDEKAKVPTTAPAK